MDMKITIQRYHLYSQEIMLQELAMDFEFVDMSAEEDYSFSSRFARNASVFCNGKGELGEIEICPVELSDPPRFMGESTKADCSISEVVMKRDDSAWAKAGSVEDGTIIWLPTDHQHIRFIDCHDVVFYLADHQVIGLLIRNRK